MATASASVAVSQVAGCRAQPFSASAQLTSRVHIAAPVVALPSQRLSASSRQLPLIRATAETAAAPAEVIATQKIRIKLKSYHVPQLEEASDMILGVAKDTGADSMGPVRLPTHFRRYCVLRSPHVDKDSREHFEIRTHKRLIDITSPTAQTIDALMQVEMPFGVAVDVKLL